MHLVYGRAVFLIWRNVNRHLRFERTYLSCNLWIGKRRTKVPNWTWNLQLLKIATWLILPVVIRSSKRLSHACLSITLLLENCERLIISVIISLVIPYYLDNRSNSRANTCINTQLLDGWYLLDWNQLASVMFWWFIITQRIACFWRRWTNQVSALSALMVVYWTTMALTGNGGLGFDSGEGAWETATTSKEGSRRVNYPILTQGGSDNK